MSDFLLRAFIALLIAGVLFCVVMIGVTGAAASRCEERCPPDSMVRVGWWAEKCVCYAPTTPAAPVRCEP